MLSNQKIVDCFDSRLGMSANQEQFCGWLNQAFPRRPDLSYASAPTDLFPGVEESQISSQPAKIMRVSALGFRHTRKVPLNETCVRLAKRIVTEGFMCGAEPALIMIAHVGGTTPPRLRTSIAILSTCSRSITRAKAVASC